MRAEERAVIVLAAGSGKRMGTGGKKQYMLIGERPLLYYPLRIFQEFGFGQVILVVGDGEESFCREQILAPYGITCVSNIVAGGKERFDSVMAGLAAVSEDKKYIYVHDGARPCISFAVLERLTQDVEQYQACVAAVLVKDTIKLADERGFVAETLPRERLWSIQTPQVFSADIIRSAYAGLAADRNQSGITDDAMVVEKYTQTPVHLTSGEYTNIKVTTQDDIIVVKQYVDEFGLHHTN